MSTQLNPDPIRPEWIISGEPTARGARVSESGRRLASGFWECTAGSFRWIYDSDEIIHIIEGEISLEFPNGHVVELGPGGTIHFTPGTEVVWTVPKYVRKFWVDHPPRRGPRHVAWRLKTRLKSLLGR